MQSPIWTERALDVSSNMDWTWMLRTWYLTFNQTVVGMYKQIEEDQKKN